MAFSVSVINSGVMHPLCGGWCLDENAALFVSCRPLTAFFHRFGESGCQVAYIAEGHLEEFGLGVKSSVSKLTLVLVHSRQKGRRLARQTLYTIIPRGPSLPA